MIRVAWMFYFSKYIELLDTVRLFSTPLCIDCLLPISFESLSNIAWPTCPLSTLVFFCAEEKTKPDHVSSRVSSLIHAMDMVVGHHLDPRWALIIERSGKIFATWSTAFLLCTQRKDSSGNSGYCIVKRNGCTDVEVDVWSMETPLHIFILC